MEFVATYWNGSCKYFTVKFVKIFLLYLLNLYKPPVFHLVHFEDNHLSRKFFALLMIFKYIKKYVPNVHDSKLV